MEKSGRRRNRRRQPFARYTNEDIILNHYGVSTSLRAMGLKGPYRFPPCVIGPCRPYTCWHSTRSPRQRLTQTRTGFGPPARQQTRSKLASLRSVKTTVQSGYSHELRNEIVEELIRI